MKLQRALLCQKKRRLIDESKRMKQSPRPMHLTRTFWVSLIVVATVSGAEPDSSNRRVMTLEDCIQEALQHNFDVQIKRYNPTFSFGGEHDYNLSPGGVDQQGRSFSGTESETDRLSTGLRGLLPWGLTYDLGGTVADRVDTRTVSIANTSAPQTYFTNIVYDAATGAPIVNVITNYDTFSIRT